MQLRHHEIHAIFMAQIYSDRDEWRLRVKKYVKRLRSLP